MLEPVSPPKASLPRRAAATLLGHALRHAPDASREWAAAMLRELDFIENDWAAFFWALGSVTAIFWHFGRQIDAWLGRQFSSKKSTGERKMDSNPKHIIGVVAGVGIGFLLAVGGLVSFLAILHLISNPGRWPGLAQLSIVLLLEGAFAVAAIRLWRTKRPMAVGILATAVVLATHVVMHVASHGL
jgi:hypothetical protein